MFSGKTADCEAIAARCADTAGPTVALDGYVLTTGVVARMFKISPLAVWLFELRGLICRHRCGNARVFSWSDCERLSLLVKAHDAGLAVRELAAVIRGMNEQASDPVVDYGRRQCLSLIHNLEIHKQLIGDLLEELYRIDWEFSERLGVEGYLERRSRLFA